MKTKNKFIIIALVCLITISSVWAGRTYAYFTASNNATGTITMGTLKVNDFGELNAETNLKVVPNQTVTKTFKATIESDIKYYKRLSLTATVKAETGKSHETTCGDYVDDDTKILNAAVANFEKYTDDDGVIYYYDLTPVTPTSSTTEEEFTVNIAVHDWVGAGGCDYYMGATINIGVKIEVIQADYLEDNGLADQDTFTTATALHNVWGERVVEPHTVTLYQEHIPYAWIDGPYYAVDGESELHNFSTNGSLQIEAKRIFICTNANLQSEIDIWNIEENILYYTNYNTSYQRQINRASTQSLINGNLQTMSSNIKQDNIDIVGGPAPSQDVGYIYIGNWSYMVDINEHSFYCLLPIYEDITIKFVDLD